MILDLDLVGRRRCAPALLMCALADVVCAQPPTLSPLVDTTIVVPAGVLHYSAINIPVGVTVRFVAPGFGPLSSPAFPAIVRCDGDAIVRGTLWLEGDAINDRPAGWVNTSEGGYGQQCGATILVTPGGGRHDYGSVYPFRLQGGSPSGWLYLFTNSCAQYQSFIPGMDGGGTLALLANGRIEVHGTITADGQSGHAGGSGGSILLRGDLGVSVLPGGVVTARGGTGTLWPPATTMGQNGNVRLDAWGSLPVIQGTVIPPPTVVQLPFLRALSQPSIGTTWELQVFAPDTGWVYVAAALGPANGGGTPTPYGLVGLDLATSARIALLTPQPSHDPYVTVQWPIPSSSALIGFAMWLQAIAVPQSLPARVSNTIAVVVQ